MPPAVVSAEVTGSTLEALMSEALLAGALPDPSDFEVRVDGVPASVIGVAVNSTLVTVELASAVGVLSSCEFDYTNPAQPLPPAPPGDNYSIPGGATVVTTTAELQTALAAWADPPLDIILEDGTYDKATRFTTSNAHRLWARNQGQAVLTAAIDLGSNGTWTGQALHGLKIAPDDAAKLTSNGAMVETWGNIEDVLIEDCELDGGATRIPGHGIFSLASQGLICRRLLIRNCLDNGIRASDNDTGSTVVIDTIHDIDVANIYRATRGASNGTAEAGLMIGHEVTNDVLRIKVRNTGWQGIAPNNACANTVFADLDVDEIFGAIPPATVEADDGTGTALYVERITTDVVVERFAFGPQIYNGFAGEWNIGNPGEAAMNGFVARHGRIDTSRAVDADAPTRGFYADDGSRDVSVHDTVFANMRKTCAGWFNDDSAATTVADFHHNDWSQREAGCVRVSDQHIADAVLIELLATDGDPPRRLLSAAPTRDDVASFTDQAVTVAAPSVPATSTVRATVQRVLGCGEYEVWITTRGGRKLIDTVPWTQVEWGRELDDTSEASLDALVGLDCCRVLEQTRPWRHELLIVRDGERVWEGPILSVTIPPEEPKLVARDLTAWWDHRLVHDDHHHVQEDLALVFEALSADAMAPDPTPRLYATTTPAGILGDLDVLGAQHKLAGPLLRDLTKNGIDWTVVGRDVLAGGVVVPVTSIGPFLTEHFVVPPTVKLDGARQANRWIVSGAGGGAEGDPIFGDAVAANAVAADGLLESTESVSTIQDTAVAEAAAHSRVELTANDVVLIENAILHPAAPFTIDQLIPGALCQLDIDTCIPVSDYYRLKSVKVTRDADGEAVALAFQPLGTLDSVSV